MHFSASSFRSSVAVLVSLLSYLQKREEKENVESDAFFLPVEFFFRMQFLSFSIFQQRTAGFLLPAENKHENPFLPSPWKPPCLPLPSSSNLIRLHDFSVDEQEEEKRRGEKKGGARFHPGTVVPPISALFLRSNYHQHFAHLEISRCTMP